MSKRIENVVRERRRVNGEIFARDTSAIIAKIREARDAEKKRSLSAFAEGVTVTVFTVAVAVFSVAFIGIFGAFSVALVSAFLVSVSALLV
jgi:hypothetical protein